MNTQLQTQARIILGPIVALLRSRKFMASFGAILVSLLVARAPELAPYADVLILGILLVAAVLTGSIAAEDAATRKAEATEAAAKTQQENLQTAIESAIELFYSRQQAQGAVLEASVAPLEVDVASLTRNVAALVTANLVEQGREPAGEAAAG